jgi:quinolinate synthase
MDNKKYGYKILYPNGDFFAYCTKKKYDIYANTRCTIIDDFTLKYIEFPKEIKHHDFTYLYSPNENPNKCFGCDIEENSKIMIEYDDENCEENVELYRNSIVSHEFMKWYPNKRDMSQCNYVLLCQNCKYIYEYEVNKFRTNLLKEFKVSNVKNNKNKDEIQPAKIIVDKYITNNNLNEFTKRWIDLYKKVLSKSKIPKKLYDYFD